MRDAQDVLMWAVWSLVAGMLCIVLAIGLALGGLLGAR